MSTSARWAPRCVDAILRHLAQLAAHHARAIDAVGDLVARRPQRRSRAARRCDLLEVDRSMRRRCASGSSGVAMNHSDVARSSRCRSRDVHGVPSGSSVANVIGSIFAPGTGRHVDDRASSPTLGPSTTRGRPAAAPSGPQGLRRRFPTGSRSWFSLQKQGPRAVGTYVVGAVTPYRQPRRGVTAPILVLQSFIDPTFLLFWDGNRRSVGQLGPTNLDRLCHSQAGMSIILIIQP